MNFDLFIKAFLADSFKLHQTKWEMSELLSLCLSTAGVKSLGFVGPLKSSFHTSRSVVDVPHFFFMKAQKRKDVMFWTFEPAVKVVTMLN